MQALECLAMSCLVTSHLMNGVMDCVEIQSLRALCKICLACCSAVLSLNSHLKVLLCAVCDNLTEKLSELGCMLSLLVSSLLIVQTDFRIALAERDARHCEIHTDF